jgi:hypothetical protein
LKDGGKEKEKKGNFSGHDESFMKILVNQAVIPECFYRESILNLVFHRKANGFPLSRE